jgi:hypothetical protein
MDIAARRFRPQMSAHLMVLRPVARPR